MMYNWENSIDKYDYNRTSRRANIPCTQIANAREKAINHKYCNFCMYFRNFTIDS